MAIGDYDDVAVVGDVIGSVRFNTFFVFETHKIIWSFLVIRETSVVPYTEGPVRWIPRSSGEELWRYDSYDVFVRAESVVDDRVIPGSG
jgi:hypothetical protein